jgi:hypothetical protein
MTMWLSNVDYTSEFLNWCSHRLDNKVYPTFATATQYPEDWVTKFRWTALPTRGRETTWLFIRGQLENIYDKGTNIPIISMRYTPAGPLNASEGWPDTVEVRLVNPLKALKYVPGRKDERTEIATGAIIHQLSRIEEEVGVLKKLVLKLLSSQEPQQEPYEEGRLITEEEANEWHNQAALEG